MPTRVEKAEKERLDAARAAARQRFDEFLQHLPQPQRTAYWDEIEIAYQPYYAYEEVLATFGGIAARVRDTCCIRCSRSRRRLTGAPTLSWTMPPADKRLGVLEEYDGWGAPKPAEKPDIAVASPVPEPVDYQSKSDSAAAAPRQDYLVYVSYARANADKSLDRFISELGAEIDSRLGRDSGVFYDRNHISIGEDWNHAWSRRSRPARSASC